MTKTQSKNPEFPHRIKLHKLSWSYIHQNESQRKELITWCKENIGTPHWDATPDVAADWWITHAMQSLQGTSVEYIPVIHVKTLDHALLVQMTWS